MVVGLQHHAQAPVVGTAVRRDDPVDHLLLQHEMRIDGHRAPAEQHDQQRARYVVRQVAHQPDSPARGEPTEVEGERIGLVNDQPRVRPARPQSRHQVAVDLHRLESLGALEQHGRERAQARADLDDALTGPRRDRVADRREDRCIGQEMLAESLARCVLHRSSRRTTT